MLSIRGLLTPGEEVDPARQWQGRAQVRRDPHRAEVRLEPGALSDTTARPDQLDPEAAIERNSGEAVRGRGSDQHDQGAPGRRDSAHSGRAACARASRARSLVTSAAAGSGDRA